MEGLSVICADLGIAEEDDNGKRIGYNKSEYCLDNLKDLLRFLRRDDPQTRDVFKQVCKWKIVSKDLVPIIEYYQDDRNLVLNAVKVLVFLTMPIEPSSSDIPQQIEYLWGLKSSVTFSNVVAVVVSLLEGPLENLELDAFTDDDWKLVQLVLTLFRNLLAIQDVSSLQKAGESANHLLSLRDRFLELLFQENVMDIFIVIAQNIDGSSSFLRQDNLLLLEVFNYIFLGQDPELVAKAHEKVGSGNKASVDSLKSIMEEEETKRKLARLHNLSSRHSQFSGTFTRLTMDGCKTVFKGNPNASESTLVEPHKGRGTAEKIAWEHGPVSSMKNKLLQMLHDFVNQFLSGGFNVLMQSIREDIEKEHHSIQNSDIILFFQVAQFATSFQYHKSLISKQPTVEKEGSEVSANDDGDGTFSEGDLCGPIAATISDSMFSLAISRWRHAFDGLKETNDFKFLSAAGSLVKTMICMLDLVLKLLPDDSREAHTTRILLYKLFYDQTDQGMCQFVLNLVKTFDTHKQRKSDLADLVETIHVIVGLMEKLQGRGTLRVSKKLRKGKKKRAPSNKKGTELEFAENHPIVSNGVGIPDSEQTADSTISRKEGSANVNSDDPGMSDLDIENGQSKTPRMDNLNLNHVNDDDLACSSDDSSGDGEPSATDEVDFKVSTFVSTFASFSIIQNLCWLLKFYKSNSNQTNHHIISMLQRITDDLDLSPMLYQLSLLVIFYKILDEQKARSCKDYEYIVDFLTNLVHGMLKKMKTQPLLFVEILFWKSRRECHYINAEYLLHELGGTGKEFRNQENVTENGESGILQSRGWTHRSIADALGEDEADVVLSHELGYQNEESPVACESEGASQRKQRLVITDDMEAKMKDLYDKFKVDKNCSRLIAESLDPEGRVSAAQVANKLRQLGLLTRKRLRNGGESFSASPSLLPLGEAQAMEADNVFDDPKQLGTSFKQPSNTRKRVSAFSKDQEALIKELYEKFKDQKRCCHLIANALGSENTFTSAQVSRKLKQLGLRLPNQKKAEADMRLRDEEPNSSSADRTDDLDNETLLAFRNRKKGKLGGKAKNEKVTRPADERMDEISGDTLYEDNKEKDRSIQSSRAGDTDSEEAMALHHVDETVTDVDIGRNLPGLSSPNNADDELADSEDDMTAVVPTQSPISRRKLKMVIDMEDDDD